MGVPSKADQAQPIYLAEGIKVDHLKEGRCNKNINTYTYTFIINCIFSFNDRAGGYGGSNGYGGGPATGGYVGASSGGGGYGGGYGNSVPPAGGGYGDRNYGGDTSAPTAYGSPGGYGDAYGGGGGTRGAYDTAYPPLPQQRG